jgi:hypothetical protein
VSFIRIWLRSAGNLIERRRWDIHDTLVSLTVLRSGNCRSLLQHRRRSQFRKSSEEPRCFVMRYVIEAGTDAASLLLFDPGALPPDFEQRLQTGTLEISVRLDEEGKVCWISTEGDGGFSLHAYVDEPIAEQLLANLFDPVRVESFPVPTGRVFFTGSEYAFRDDDQLLRQHPHMGGFFTIRPGAYRLNLYRGVYPSGALEQRFGSESSTWEFILWNSMRVLIPLAVAAWIGLVVIFFTRSRVPWPPLLAPSLGLIFVLPFLVRRLETYRLARERYASLEREYPSFIAELEYRQTIRNGQDE